MAKPKLTARERRLKMLRKARELQRESKNPRSFDSLIGFLEGKVKSKAAKVKR